MSETAKASSDSYEKTIISDYRVKRMAMMIPIVHKMHIGFVTITGRGVIPLNNAFKTQFFAHDERIKFVPLRGT